MTPIYFTSEGYQLAGNIFAPAKPQPIAFLFIQGWLGYQNLRAAQKLSQLGFTSMTYDMRGNQASEGDITTFSRADFINDSLVAYDYLQKQVPKGTVIGVVGSSFGSYTASLLSTKREVYCLSLRVPASYPDEGFTAPQFPQSHPDSLIAWSKRKVDHADNYAFEALHNFAGNIQIIEAGSDELVGHQAVQNYVDAVRDKTKLSYFVMEGAPHGLANDALQAQYEQLLSEWVQSIGPTATNPIEN